MPVALRYAARSDVGLGRYTNNQDSGYAGPHLLAVCDGMGGHAGGDVASSVALGRLVDLDGDSHGGEALRRLGDALRQANAEIARQAADDPQLAGMGTTATVLMRYDRKLALAHIGDSRGYLLRDGELTRLTRDHTFVQTLVDEGRISPDEAEQHPQRNIVTRVLSGHPDDEPDVSAREARVGDRYLLCSDGLTGVVSEATIAETLGAGDDPAATAEALISMALRGGAPDNVTVVVAQVVDAHDPLATDVPEVVGSAAVTGTVPSAAAATPAGKAAALTRGQQPQPVTGAEQTAAGRPRTSRRRWLARALAAAVVAAVLAAGTYAAWTWSQDQYYVGAAGQDVAIYRGLPQDIGPVSMSRVYEVQDDLPLARLPEYSRQQVRSTITADDLADARAKVGALRSQAADCASVVAAPRPSAGPGPSAGAPTGRSTGTALAGRTPSTPVRTVPTARATTVPTARATTQPTTQPTPPPPTQRTTQPTPPTTAPAGCAGAAS